VPAVEHSSIYNWLVRLTFKADELERLEGHLAGHVAGMGLGGDGGKRYTEGRDKMR